jgi:hypothetical protein
MDVKTLHTPNFSLFYVLKMSFFRPFFGLITVIAIFFVGSSFASKIHVETAAEATPQTLIYYRDCSNVSTTGECKYHTQVSGSCVAISTQSTLYVQCLPADYANCVFATNYNNSQCAGEPSLPPPSSPPSSDSSPFVLNNRCDYCQEDFDGGNQGMEYSCNSTGWVLGVCDDFACMTCPDQNFRPYGKCLAVGNEGVIYDALPCPPLYLVQNFPVYADCPYVELANMPMETHVSPYTYGDVTVSCDPFY